MTQIHGRRCDCVACLGFRLAAGMFLIGLGIIMVLGLLTRAAEPKPLLIDAAPPQAGLLEPSE